MEREALKKMLKDLELFGTIFPSSVYSFNLKTGSFVQRGHPAQLGRWRSGQTHRTVNPAAERPSGVRIPPCPQKAGVAQW